MMTLIALAISTAYFYSVAITLLGKEKLFTGNSLTLITIMLWGTGWKCVPSLERKSAQRNFQTPARYGGGCARRTGVCRAAPEQKRRYCACAAGRQDSGRRHRERNVGRERIYGHRRVKTGSQKEGDAVIAGDT